MRIAAWLIPIAAWGCKDAPTPEAGSPKSAASAASAASEAPATVATAAPRADTSLDAMRAATVKTCVRDGLVRRTCAEFRKLRTAVRGHRDDPAWWGALLVDAKGESTDPKTLVALTLLSDGTLQGPKPQFVPAVKPMLTSDSPPARAAALRALSSHADPSLGPVAVKLLETDTSADVREAAAYLLGRSVHHGMREKSVPLLLSVLVNDADPSVRRAAIGALGKLKPPEAVKLLITLLDHPQLGPNAAVQIGGFDDPAAFRAVLSRIAKAKEGKMISPSLFASLGRMQAAKAFDKSVVRAVLTDVRPALEAQTHPTKAVAIRMLDRLLKSLDGPAAPAAGTPAEKKAPK